MIVEYFQVLIIENPGVVITVLVNLPAASLLASGRRPITAVLYLWENESLVLQAWTCDHFVQIE